jgi:benzoyl-CoA reductase/2-hydroxyglutaryl-CoA dehydratase subunit BcrC/BadD/HgdB
MGNKYEAIWQELGLNLENHAGLLGVLGDAYQSIYQSQQNRPNGMAYFDFAVSEVHGLRIKEIYQAKQAGKPVVGAFCIFAPEEIVLAVNGVCIGLCAGAEVGSEAAEKFIPRNTCALIKGFMGFKLAGLCPYVELTDLIVGETTCDGKKKAYEIFNEITGKVYVMEIPNAKSSKGRELWETEVGRFLEKMESLSGRKATVESLKEGISVVNAKRQALQRLSALRAADPAPISGLDALLVNQISFYDDPVRFTQMTNQLCDELEERVKAGTGVRPKGAKRLLLSGSPMAIPNWKLHAIVEGSGAVIVGEEACIGERNFRDLVDDDFSTVEEGIAKMTDRFCSIDCACFTPNDDRIGNIKSLRDRLAADGVLHYSLQFCTPYLMESFKVERSFDTPFLKLETDYSMEDMGQLKTRVEAFLEIL